MQISAKAGRVHFRPRTTHAQSASHRATARHRLPSPSPSPSSSTERPRQTTPVDFPRKPKREHSIAPVSVHHSATSFPFLSLPVGHVHYLGSSIARLQHLSDVALHSTGFIIIQAPLTSQLPHLVPPPQQLPSRPSWHRPRCSTRPQVQNNPTGPPSARTLGRWYCKDLRTTPLGELCRS